MKLLNYFPLSSFDYDRFTKLVNDKLCTEPVGSITAVSIEETPDYITLLIFGDICFLAIYDRKSHEIRYCPNINFDINVVANRIEKHIIFGHTSSETYYNPDIEKAWFRFINSKTAFVSIIKELNIFEKSYTIFKSIPKDIIDTNSKEIIRPYIEKLLHQKGDDI